MLKRLFIASLAPVIAIAGLAFANSAASASQASMSREAALRVTAGNGGSISVLLPSTEAGGAAASASSDAISCPGTRVGAAEYLQTVAVEPDCSGASSTWTVANGVPPNYGHN